MNSASRTERQSAAEPSPVSRSTWPKPPMTTASRPARSSTDSAKPSRRRSVREKPAPIPGASQAAPLTSNGELKPRSHGFDRPRLGQFRHDERGLGLGPRRELDRCFCQYAERAVRAAIELGEVEAGACIYFITRPAAADRLAKAVHELEAEDTRRAPLPRSAGAAPRGWSRPCRRASARRTIPRAPTDASARTAASARARRSRPLCGDRRPGPGAERHFGRGVEVDARHRRDREPPLAPARSAESAMAGAADDVELRPGDPRCKHRFHHVGLTLGLERFGSCGPLAERKHLHPG